MTGIEPALSAWELDCQASLTSAPQLRPHLKLSASVRQVLLLTLPSGTQRARTSEVHDLDRFLIREVPDALMLSRLVDYLRLVIRVRPQVSVPVSGDRHSGSYSPLGLIDDPAEAT